jgi:hypothetical protein
MSRSSAGNVSNATMIQVRDDRHNREQDYDELLQSKLPPSITNQMLPRGFLVAAKPIAADEEILWYNPNC